MEAGLFREQPLTLGAMVRGQPGTFSRTIRPQIGRLPPDPETGPKAASQRLQEVARGL